MHVKLAAQIGSLLIVLITRCEDVELTAAAALLATMALPAAKTIYSI